MRRCLPLTDPVPQTRLVSWFDAFTRKLPINNAVAALSVGDFLHGFSLVSSRAFHIDAYHTLALVPLADIFNHSDTPHVHLASDHWVCPACGTLRECPHDEQGGGSAVGADHDLTGGNDTCDMVTELDVFAGEEVYNTYGRLSNGRLLASYGFTLEGSEQDEILIDQSLVVEAVRRQFGAVRDLGAEARTGSLWKFRDPTLSYLADALAQHPLVVWDRDQAKLSIDADGRISIGFFVLASSLFLGAQRGSGSEHPGMSCSPDDPLALLVELLEIAEARFEASEDTVPDRRHTGNLEEHLRQIALVIHRACTAYVERQERPELDCEELLDMADSLSGEVGLPALLLSLQLADCALNRANAPSRS